MTHKENIKAILECNFAGFKEEIIDSACNRILEQESFINKPCVAHQVCHEDKVKMLDKIRAEIEEHVKINQCLNVDRARALCWCLDVIDKYKESEG